MANFINIMYQQITDFYLLFAVIKFLKIFLIKNVLSIIMYIIIFF